MKGRKLLLLALIVFFIGLILTITFKDIRSTGIVICGGILFILAGLLNLFTLLGNKDKHPASDGRAKGQSVTRMVFTWITSMAAVVLGICMLFFQATFITLVPILFGILVLSTGLFNFYILALAIRPVKLPAWFYLGGLGLVGCAIYLFTLKAGADDSTLMLASGIALMCFAALTLAEGLMVGSHRRELIKSSSRGMIDTKNEIEDVSAKEIKGLDD